MEKEVKNAMEELLKINEYQEEINKNLGSVKAGSKERKEVIGNTMSNKEEIDELLKMMKSWK